MGIVASVVPVGFSTQSPRMRSSRCREAEVLRGSVGTFHPTGERGVDAVLSSAQGVPHCADATRLGGTRDTGWRNEELGRHPSVSSLVRLHLFTIVAIKHIERAMAFPESHGRRHHSRRRHASPS